MKEKFSKQNGVLENDSKVKNPLQQERHTLIITMVPKATTTTTRSSSFNFFE